MKIDPASARTLQEVIRSDLEAVNRHDCRLLGQIQDPGRGRHEKGRTPDAIGPSPLPDDLSWTVPRARPSAAAAARALSRTRRRLNQ